MKLSSAREDIIKILSIIVCALILSTLLPSCGLIGGSSKGSDGGRKVARREIISEQEAKDIALNKVEGATEDDLVRFEREYDDGHLIYEGEILYQGIEYEFEIEGESGTIIDWEIDR